MILFHSILMINDYLEFISGYLTLKFRSQTQPLVLLPLQNDINAYKTLVHI